MQPPELHRSIDHHEIRPSDEEPEHPTVPRTEESAPTVPCTHDLGMPTELPTDTQFMKTEEPEPSEKPKPRPKGFAAKAKARPKFELSPSPEPSASATESPEPAGRRK